MLLADSLGGSINNNRETGLRKMSNIFERNINALKEKNLKLAQKLEMYILTDVPQLVKENNSYNFLYKGVLLHNKINPLREAAEIFGMCENTPVAIHLIYGLGLGYLFQVVSAKSNGTVILYEPDLNILRTAFGLVDFTQDILKLNVFITDNYEDVCEYIYKKSNTKNTPLLLTTPEYRELNKDLFEKLVTDLQQEVGRFGLDLKYTKERFYSLLTSIINNIPKLIKEVPIGEFKDYYKGKTAVVISAGPTLDRNLETIKKYRDNIILISVGPAMKTLIGNNIIPDFLCIIEANDCSKQIAGLDLKDVNFITEPFSNPNLRKFDFKKTYSHISSNFPVNSFWCSIAGINNNEYSSKGTVSYTALNIARLLGCSKIVLVGQDLAYIEGQCYSKNSAYKDLICTYNKTSGKWEITAKDFENYCMSLANDDNPEIRKQKALKRINDLNKSLYYVKGINGDMLPTESVYAAFIKPLSDYTKIYPDREYINTSLVGAQIDGFKNIPLEEALKDTLHITDKELHTDFEYDTVGIKENLFKARESLQSVFLIIEELKKICKHLNNDLTRYQNVTQEVLKGLKRLSTGYVTLNSKFAKTNMLFDFMTIAERIDIDYEMKMMREFTLESVKHLVNVFNIFIKQTEEKINAISKNIDKILGEL